LLVGKLQPTNQQKPQQPEQRAERPRWNYRRKADSPTNQGKDSKDQNHRKHRKGEQAQTLAKLQELHPNKKRLKSQDIEATDEEYEAERSLDKRI